MIQLAKHFGELDGAMQHYLAPGLAVPQLAEFIKSELMRVQQSRISVPLPTFTPDAERDYVNYCRLLAHEELMLNDLLALLRTCHFLLHPTNRSPDHA